MAKAKKKKEVQPLQIKKKIISSKGNQFYYYIFGIGIIIPVFYLISIFYYTGGHFSLPIDDAFSYLQYAKQIANGSFFHFNDGDTLSTGIWSLLYTLLLVPGHFLGLEGNLMVSGTFILGIILFLASAWFIFNIGKMLFNQEMGMVMGLFFVLHGPTSWGYLSGGEIGLFATSILAVLYVFLIDTRDNGSYWKTIIFASFLAISRPEGIVLAGILSIILFFNSQIKTKGLYCLIPLGIGGISILINLVMSNSFFTTAFQRDTLIFQPNTPFLEVIEKGMKFYAYILKDIFSGFGGDYNEIMNSNTGQVSTYFAPFSLLFFLLGSLPLAIREITYKKPSVNFLIVTWFFLGTLISAIAFPYNHFWNKYLIAYYPIFIISMVIGLYHFSHLISNILSDTFLKEVFYGVSAFILIFSMCGLFHFATAYGKNAKDYYHREITLSKWIKDKIPAQVRIATVGSRGIKYFIPNHVIDLSGGVTKEFTIPYRHGIGAIFEYMEKMDKQPECMILPKNGLDFSQTGILSEQLHSVKVVGVRELEPLEVYRTDWSLSNSGDNPKTKLEGYEIVDTIDIADLESESKHRYYFWEAEPGLPVSTYAYRLPFVDGTNTILLDGGRSISGGEEMIIQTNQLQELKIIMRTVTDFGLQVRINDKFVKRWENKKSPGNVWIEAICTLPAQWITSDKTKLEIQVLDRQQDIYTNAHYWFLQKKS